MTFSQFIAIVRARAKVFWAILLGVIVLGVGGSLVWPKKYTAVATVVVDIKPDPVSAMVYQTMLNPAVMATQVDIIQSDRVARRVIRNLKLAENPQIRQEWEDSGDKDSDIETWLVEVFQRDLDVKPSRESSVISVAYKGRDPRFAAGVANAFVQAYVDTSLDLRVDPAKQYSTFFDTRAKEARELLEKAQTRLSKFQNESGVIMTDERLDIETQRLNELTSQLVGIQALSSESNSRQGQVASGSVEKLQEVTNNPLVGSLRVDLGRQEARLQELNSKLGENNPQVIELRANIAELRQKIDAEIRRIGGGVGVTNVINKQREAQVRADLEAQRAKVLKLKQVRDEGAVIQRDIENAQRSYDTILARLTQSSLESQTTQSSVTVLAPATPPLLPSSPKMLLNAILSVFLGGLAALSAVLVLELRDRRLRSADDVVAMLGLPVIGILPSLNAKNSKKKRARQALQHRLVGQIAAPKTGN
jgi:chain length determinant protein EpsF